MQSDFEQADSALGPPSLYEAKWGKANPVTPIPLSDFEQADSALGPPSLYEAKWGKANPVTPIPRSMSRYYPYWRGGIDIIFALVGIFFLFLILPLLALLIYFDSPGPIFYHQERVGYRGRKFSMHKFRSMYSNAEQAGHAEWTSGDDARVTRIGHFMRATHLDELPQVFNILRGEMSLIGPRPEREEYIAELEKANPLFHSRLNVKPGLTGLAQVIYGYGSTSQEELIKLQYDLYYIEHQSFMLDIRIILKTVVEVVLCHGK
jgi:lipopolysaccharide/colanic/teichoic acid biosynthesis glycosyltransferase